jgi:3D (Asp-Asp-Asp) domain-containing protein
MIKSSHNYFIMFMYLISVFSITWYADKSMDKMHEEIMTLQEINDELKRQMNVTEFEVTVTMYNPTKGQCDSTPNITADGTRINPRKASSYRYIALSRDLLSRWGGPFNYGDYVIIEGTGKDDGVYQVRDTMNPRFTKRVDILKSKGSRKFKYNSVKLYKHNEIQNDVFAYND